MHIKKVAEYTASEMLRPLLGKRGISSQDKELREDVYVAMEIYCRRTPLDIERMRCLLDSFSKKLKLESRETSEKLFDGSDIEHLEAVNTLHEHVIKEIRETDSPSIEQSLQWSTYFLITLSGACYKELTDAAVRHIQYKKNPVERVGQFHLMQLFYSKGNHFSNAKDADNQPMIEKLLFLEPTSLISINGYQERKRKYPVMPKVIEQAYKILKPLLKRAPNSRALSLISERQFFKAAALRIMMNPYTSMPQWLRFFADGSAQSSSMTLGGFRALVEGSLKATSNGSLIRANVIKVQRRQRKENNSSVEKPSTNPFLAEVLDATKCPITKCFRPVNETKRRLKGLAARDWPTAKEILLEWALYELEQGSWNASSTLVRHLSAIGIPWLLVCKDIELIALDVDQVTWLYESILELRAVDDSNVINSLRSLLSFTNKYYSFALPEPLQNKKSETMVVNTLPSEAHFQQLQVEIANCFINETTEIQEAIQLMLILIRRLFLRPYEVTGIRIKDVSINDIESLLLVRRHPFIFIKTYSAVRQLPAHLLLKKDELGLLQRFLTKRKNQANGNSNRLLFSTDPHYDIPFSSSTFSRPVTKLLTTYLGEHTPCYQFRHAGQSAMQLILFGNNDFIEQLTPYTTEQAMKIRKWVARDGKNETLFQLSSLAGHLSPSMTLSTYAHHTDLLLYQSCCNLSVKYPLQFWQNLSGQRPTRLLKNLNGKSVNGYLSGFDILPELQSEPSGSKKVQLKQQSNIECKKNTIATHSYSPEDCETVLRAFDQDSTNYAFSAVKCGLTESWASNVLSAAKSIKQHEDYITRRGKNSRLYPIGSNKLSPPEPQSLIEREYVKAIWKVLSKKFQNGNGWQRIRKSFDYMFRHTSHGHSGITFSCPSQLNKFLRVLIPILPDTTHWLLVLEPNSGIDAITPESQKFKWEQKIPIDIILTKYSNVTGKDLYPAGRASLHLLNPNISKEDLDGLSYRKYSTNALQYAAHVFAIYQSAYALEKETEE